MWLAIICFFILKYYQLKDLIVRSIEAWVELFDLDDNQRLPIFKMELTYDNDKMEFYPYYSDLEETVLFVVLQLTRTMQSVPTVQSWLSGTNELNSIDVTVADHVVITARKTLKEVCKMNFEGPSAHLDSYSEYMICTSFIFLFYHPTGMYMINKEQLQREVVFLCISGQCTCLYLTLFFTSFELSS